MALEMSQHIHGVEHETITDNDGNRFKICTCKHPPTTLQIHKREQGGYYLKHPEKGIVVWYLEGEAMLGHLAKHYVGSLVEVCCDFQAGMYGSAQGSIAEPVVLEWDIRNK
jgi:hypothetical protein